MIKFAVIGCGHIGKRHAQMILENTNSSLVGLCDILPSTELDIKRFETSFFNDYAKMLDETHPDVVCVCTPNGLHFEHSDMALSKGIHVVCEKPLGLSKKQSEVLLHKSLTCNRFIFCVMQNRYSPPSVWIKEVIEHRLLGDIFMVQINCFWNRDDRYYKPSKWKGTNNLDGGTLFTQFSHFVDIMYWLFGDIENISGIFKDFNHKKSTDFEDSGMINFEFKNIKMGIGSINYSTSVFEKNLESSMTIIGERGSVKIGGQYMDKVVHCHIDNYTLPTLAPSNPPNDYGFYKGSAANHHFIIQNVIETLRGKESATTNALEGLKVVEIIEKIYAERDKSFKK